MSSANLASFICNLLVMCAALAATLLLPGCTSGLGKKFGTNVTAQGNTIAVNWDKQHVWRNKLNSRPADLVAEYRTEARGLVRERLARASSNSDRTYRFSLPESLTSRPLDEVCLYIQLVGERGLLPIHRADNGSSDTARFRYAEWEKAMHTHADQQAGELHLANLENEMAMVKQQLDAGKQALKSRGIDSLASCESLTTSETILRKPYDVVPESEHDATARRVCVHRALVGRSLLMSLTEYISKSGDNVSTREKMVKEYLSINGYIRELAGEILKGDLSATGSGAQASLYKARQAQARELLDDWKKYSPTVGKGYKPPLGALDDYLRLNAAASSTAFALFGPKLLQRAGVENVFTKKTVNQKALLGLIGAALDSYSGCVKDGRKQLKIKLDAWQALKAAIPVHDRMRKAFFVEECRQEVDKTQKNRAAYQRLRSEIEKERESIQSLRPPEEYGRVHRVLNYETCN